MKIIIITISVSELFSLWGHSSVCRHVRTSSLQLETLQLSDSAVKVEHHILLLQKLALLRGRWQNHGAVRSIQLEEDRTLGMSGVLAGRDCTSEILVLVVRVAIVHVGVEHSTGISQRNFSFVVLQLELEVLGKGLR